MCRIRAGSGAADVDNHSSPLPFRLTEEERPRPRIECGQHDIKASFALGGALVRVNMGHEYLLEFSREKGQGVCVCGVIERERGLF